MNMRSPLGLSTAWLAVATFSIIVASVAVGSVRSQVTNVPTVLGSGAELGVAPPSNPAPRPEGTTPPDTNPAASTQIPPTTMSPSPSSTTQTAPTPASSTTSTTTTTTPAPVTTVGSTTHTFDTTAGSVNVVVSGESVTFGGAFPKPGWRVELEKSGPDTVEVHFERNDSDEEEEVQFKAWVDDGELQHEISEEG
jgi:hypothetical protein